MSKTEPRIRELLRQVKALADSGATEGERAAASNKLKVLMEKYNVSVAELTSEEITEHILQFRFKNIAERLIACQVYYWIINDKEKSEFWVFKNKRGFGYQATKLQDMRLQEEIPYYIRAFRKQQRDFASAFIQSNDLFPDADRLSDLSGLTQEQIEHMMRVAAMAQGIKPTPKPHMKLPSRT